MEKIKIIIHKLPQFPFLLILTSKYPFSLCKSTFAQQESQTGALDSIFFPIIVSSILPCASGVSFLPYFSSTYKIAYNLLVIKYISSSNFVQSLRHLFYFHLLPNLQEKRQILIFTVSFTSFYFYFLCNLVYISINLLELFSQRKNITDQSQN